jgi:hypothetical protein
LISRRSILVFIERRQREGLIYIIISSQTKGSRPRWTLGIARRADGLAFHEGAVTMSKGFLVQAAVTGNAATGVPNTKLDNDLALLCSSRCSSVAFYNNGTI